MHTSYTQKIVMYAYHGRQDRKTYTSNSRDNNTLYASKHYVIISRIKKK